MKQHALTHKMQSGGASSEEGSDMPQSRQAEAELDFSSNENSSEPTEMAPVPIAALAAVVAAAVESPSASLGMKRSPPEPELAMTPLPKRPFGKPDTLLKILTAC